MKRGRPGDPTRAVGYVRVSTEEQHLGPEAQRAGVTFVAWHTETGVSGARELDGRPALMSALDAPAKRSA